ncbi:MAG: beta-glucosidase BglX [Bosea sp. (in: a-proteobacteria)]
MFLRLFAALIFCVTAVPHVVAQVAPSSPVIGWRNAADSARIERQIDALLAKMTLAEKVGQLHLYGRREGFDLNDIRSGRVGNVMNYIEPSEMLAVQRAVRESRLKIPLLIGLDAVHGVSTYFPQPLGQAATFNPALVEEAARWTGREARALGVNWTFAPMVDMSRDPRWGRVIEGAGEDVHLANVMAAARTRGYQAGGVAATVKHFAGYGAGEAGRDYNSAWMAPEQLHDLHLPPFKASLNAGAMSVMAAFNALNAVPATADRAMLTDLLRTKWGFRGFVVSDFGSIIELMDHGIARDEPEAARKALKAGVDIDMMSFVYDKHLANEVRAGRVPMAEVDQAVRRVLRVKFHAGLFEQKDIDPATVSPLLRSEEALEAARRVARESIILLENRDAILPLDPAKVKSVAVIGALARPDLERAWTDPAGVTRKPIEGLDEALRRLGGAELSVNYAPGVTTYCGKEMGDKQQAIRTAASADVIVAVLGEDCEFMGEAASRTRLNLPGVQEELLDALVATGKPVVLVLATGRPLVLTHIKDRVAALVQTFHSGSEGRTAIAEVLTGAVSPSGKVPMSFLRSVGQIPVYYDHLPTGRPEKVRQRYESIFIDEANEPLYPFGFGLSFTKFALADVEVEQPRISIQGKLRVSVQISNLGARTGQEVLQLYVRQPVAKVSRPVKQLKAFAKVSLQPGETRRVLLEVSAAELGFHDAKGRYAVEPGGFEAMIGTSSRDLLKTSFTVAAP